MSLARFTFFSLAIALVLTGCKSGLGTIFSSSDDNSSNSPSSVSGLAITGAQSSPATLKFRLLDGDGDLELITATGKNGDIAIFDGEGAFSFSDEPVLLSAGGSTDLIVDDIDGDGDLVLLEQLAPGIFATKPSLSVPSGHAPAIALRFEDVDGDGELDALLPNARIGTGEMRILWGNE